MNSTTASETRDPAEIEREIRNTQADMSRTVDQIGDQLTPRNLVNGLLEKAEANGIDARYLVDGARRNPLALAMIALGGIWLVSDSDAKVSSIKSSSLGSGLNSVGDKLGETFDRSSGDDQFHRDYIEHMSRCEPQPNEDQLLYRRRRDLARSNYLMIEQGHEEDEGTFRQRLDQATEALRRRRHDLMHSAQDMGRTAGTSARGAATKVGETYQSNPLVGGIVAALVGAVAGSLVPITRIEEEQMGELGASALDVAKEKGQTLADMAREKKDELLDKADQKMSEIAVSPSSEGQSSQRDQAPTGQSA